jgi:hypothetical protein
VAFELVSRFSVASLSLTWTATATNARGARAASHQYEMLELRGMLR